MCVEYQERKTIFEKKRSLELRDENAKTFQTNEQDTIYNRRLLS